MPIHQGSSWTFVIGSGDTANITWIGDSSLSAGDTAVYTNFLGNPITLVKSPDEIKINFITTYTTGESSLILENREYPFIIYPLTNGARDNVNYTNYLTSQGMNIYFKRDYSIAYSKKAARYILTIKNNYFIYAGNDTLTKKCTQIITLAPDTGFVRIEKNKITDKDTCHCIFDLISFNK